MTQPTTTLTAPELPELAPFSGEHTACAMCANPGAFTRYRPAVTVVVEEYNGMREQRGPLPVRLERRCGRCDYMWDEDLAPALGTQPATPEQVLAVLGLCKPCEEHPDAPVQGVARLLDLMTVTLRLDHPAWSGALLPLLTPQAPPVETAPTPTTDAPTVPAGEDVDPEDQDADEPSAGS